MAHSFVNKPIGIQLTCNLRDALNINVDGDFVDIKIIAPNGDIILYERYYEHNGAVKIFDLGSLIECNMRSYGYQYALYTIALLDENESVTDSCSINALYCDRFSVCTNLNVFLAENFLSTLNMRRIPIDSSAFLYFFASAGENISISISYLWRSATNNSRVIADNLVITRGVADIDGIYNYSLAQSLLKTDAFNKFGTPKNEIEIIRFSISIGQRSVTYFIDRTLNEEDCFIFRNCFNVREFAYIPLTTTAKTEVERSTAIVNQISLLYDQHTNKTYEAQSGTLTSDEAEWIDQLFTSYEVIRFVPNDCDDTEPYLMQQVLITESHCEISDGDDKPNTVKFTWRFADNRAIVRLTASPGIFTSPYNIMFS